MKNQALFSSEDKSKKLKCRLLQLFLALYGLKYQILSVSSFYQFVKCEKKI